MDADLQVAQLGLGQAAPPLPAPAAASLPGAPSVPGGLGLRLPAIQGTSPEMEQAFKGAQDESSRFQQTVRPLEQRVSEARSILSKGLDEPMPQAPKLQDVPEFHPRQLSGQEMTAFAGIAMALAGLGTKAMRGDMAMAFNAAGSMIKGFNEGNIQQANLDLKNFQEKATSIINQNNKISAEYKSILENRKLSLWEKSQQVAIAAGAVQDEAMMHAAKMSDFKLMFDKAAAVINANNQFALHSAQLVMHAEQMRQSHLDRMALINAQTQRVQSKPIFVQKPDGSMTQIVPQFDESGQVANIPAGWKVVGSSAGSQTRGGAQNARYAFNVTESFEQAATDLVNVSKMPAGTVLGSFAGLTGQSGDTLQRSLSTTLARKITPADARMLQQLVSGLEMNMARALGGGYAQSSAGHLIEAYKQQIPKAGDSSVTTAMFLARVKQELGVLANAFQGHPGATPEWTKQMKDYMAEVDRAIPYTVPDVLHATSRGRATISQQWRKLATEPVKIQIPSDIPRISSDAEYEALPPGPFIDPEGKQRTKP